MSFNAMTVFHPNSIDCDDGDDYSTCQNLIKKLITEQITPAQAAEDFDKWVTRETNKKYDNLQQRDPPFTLTPGESGYLDGPDADRLFDIMVEIVAKICSAFPPGHIAQNSLIEFFLALKALPRHDVPDTTYTDIYSAEDDEVFVGREPSFDGKMTLWTFGDEQQGHPAWNFFEENIAYPYSDVETLGSEIQLRWRNFQSFISRLTALKVMDCSEACALGYILPTYSGYPNLEVHKKGGPRRITGDLIAAAHWLDPDDIRKWVFNQCKSNIGEGKRCYVKWTMETWNAVKAQLSFVSSDARFEQEIRDLAQSLKEKMEAEE